MRTIKKKKKKEEKSVSESHYKFTAPHEKTQCLIDVAQNNISQIFLEQNASDMALIKLGHICVFETLGASSTCA